MPWTAASGTRYDLCLLDTNALSEILKNKNNERIGFLKNFPPDRFAPCLTIYNLIELRRKDQLYHAFLQFFAYYPFFILKPRELIIRDEFLNYDYESYVSPLLNAFSPSGSDSSYDLKVFFEELFNNSEMQSIENNWRDLEHDVLGSWLSTKDNFEPTQSFPNSKDAERFIDLAGLQTLIRLNLQWCSVKINSKIEIDIDRFPYVKASLYSLYYRIYDPSWKRSSGEVTDILISSIVPYVDCFITEKFQANVISKIKQRVKGLDQTKVNRISSLNYEEENTLNCNCRES